MKSRHINLLFTLLMGTAVILGPSMASVASATSAGDISDTAYINAVNNAVISDQVANEVLSFTIPTNGTTVNTITLDVWNSINNGIQHTLAIDYLISTNSNLTGTGFGFNVYAPTYADVAVASTATGNVLGPNLGTLASTNYDMSGAGPIVQQSSVQLEALTINVSDVLSAGTYHVYVTDAYTTNGSPVYWNGYTTLSTTLPTDDGGGGTGAVPEPATMLLLGSGLVGLWVARRKLKR